MGFPEGPADLGSELSNEAYQLQKAVSVGQVTLKTRLELAVRQAEERLAEAKRAREILNKNPELEELLNIMQKGHF